MKEFENVVLDILKRLGAGGSINRNNRCVNSVTTLPATVHGTTLIVNACDFGETCRIDIDFRLPEGSVEAQTFMDNCAEIEHTAKNHHGEYAFGPTYPDWMSENRKKQTFAYCGGDWHDFFYVRSERYPTPCLQEAADNAVGLARQFVDHLADLSTMRYWKPEDEEVAQKAKEIIENADLYESDFDREERTHWLVDRNSFIKGWFIPFNDRGRGTFDTVWPSSLDYAARNMGLPGSFEYAVSCLVLKNPEYIAKARKACVIRTETRTVRL